MRRAEKKLMKSMLPEGFYDAYITKEVARTKRTRGAYTSSVYDKLKNREPVEVAKAAYALAADVWDNEL